MENVTLNLKYNVVNNKVATDIGLVTGLSIGKSTVRIMGPEFGTILVDVEVKEAPQMLLRIR